MEEVQAIGISREVGSMKNREASKGGKASGGEGSAKGGGKPSESSARNTVSRIDSTTHENTPKVAQAKQKSGSQEGNPPGENGSTSSRGGCEADSDEGAQSGPRSNTSTQGAGGAKLNGLRVAILATDGFEIAELVKPRKALDDAGAKTTVIAPKVGSLQGVNHDEKGEKVPVDAELASAKAGDFDAVLLPGGALNADALRMDKHAQKFVQEMDTAGKPIAVICHAPWLLISAGLTRGRKMTSYHTIQDDVKNSGAEWEDSEVIRDGNWVSSRQPDDIPAFNREMISLFGAKQVKAKTAAG
jgi:protease I